MPIHAAYIGAVPEVAHKVTEMIKTHFKDIVVIANMDNPEETIDLIYHLNLDLIIMDIDFPNQTDKDILHLVPEKFADKTVVISDDPRKAVAAMHKGILDFIEKPVSIDSMQQIVTHFKQHLEHEQALNSIVSFDRIVVNRHDKAYLLELDSILYFTADGAYTQIYISGDKRISSSKPLGYYRDLLENKKNFAYLNRSLIVNIQNIKEIVKEEGEGTVILKDNSRLEVSRASKNKLMQILNDLQSHSL